MRPPTRLKVLVPRGRANIFKIGKIMQTIIFNLLKIQLEQALPEPIPHLLLQLVPLVGVGAPPLPLMVRHRKRNLALPLELVAGRTSGAGQTLVDRLHDTRRQAIWITAVRAEAVGRCKAGFLGQAAISYRPTHNDLVALRRGTRLLAQLHFESGATRVRPGIYGLPFEIGPDQLRLLDEAPLDNRAWTWVLSHLFGGAVMGADPQRSVVAPDLHVRGVRGLHVACAAALPSTLGVNPQHTIMAVARILATRLANETQRS